MKPETLGVDIGGGLIDRVADGSDTSFFSGRFLETPAVEGGFAALARLRARFGDAIHVVSKCGPATQARSRQWLAHRRFAEFTGITEDRLHFCRKRGDKAPICERLGVTHFVDDRLDVLLYLKTALPVGPDGDDLARSKTAAPAGLKIVLAWAEIEADLL